MPIRTPLVAVDQAIASGSNILLTVLVARAETPPEFGYFAMAYAGYLFMLGITRAVVGEVLLIRFHGRQAQAWASSALAASGFIGLLFCLLALCVSMVTGSQAVLILALAGPLLAVQETLRQLAMAMDSTRALLVNDGLWLGSFLVFVWQGGDHYMGSMVVGVWVACSVPGVFITCNMLRNRRSVPPLNAIAWVRRSSDLIRPALLQTTVGLGVRQAGVSLVAAVGTAVNSAALRGSLTLYGPSGVVLAATVQSSTRRFSSDMRAGRRVGWRAIGSASAFAVGICAMWILVIQAVPESLGYELLGPTWQYAAPLILPVGALMLADSAGSGVQASLLANEQIGFIARLRVVTGLLELAAWVFLTALAGIEIAVWGVAAAAWIRACAGGWKVNKTLSISR